jgi:serine palmitoyltransferase
LSKLKSQIHIYCCIRFLIFSLDAKHLEEVIRDAVIKGQPRTHRPWEKILIVVEGVYSMEGVICPLPDIVRIKKKYKVLFLSVTHITNPFPPHFLLYQTS